MPANTTLAFSLSFRAEIIPDAEDDQEAVAAAIVNDLHRCIRLAYETGTRLVIFATPDLVPRERPAAWQEIQRDCMRLIKVANPRKRDRELAKLLQISAPQMSRLKNATAPFTTKTLAKLRACVEAGTLSCDPVVLVRIEQTLR